MFDSEIKVMEVLWSRGDLPAKEVADILAREIGWNKNTTYTIIKKCVAKGAVLRREPHFICRAQITKDEAREFELSELINKLYDGSADLLFASLLGKAALGGDALARLRDMVDRPGDNG